MSTTEASTPIFVAVSSSSRDKTFHIPTDDGEGTLCGCKGTHRVTTRSCYPDDTGHWCDDCVAQYQHESKMVDMSAVTGRQYEVLETAYNMGFFEFPRDNSGLEVSDALDISQPTFNKHLRVAMDKIVGQLLVNEEQGKTGTEHSHVACDSCGNQLGPREFEQIIDDDWNTRTVTSEYCENCGERRPDVE